MTCYTVYMWTCILSIFLNKWLLRLLMCIFDNLTLWDFRFECKYEIEYKYDFEFSNYYIKYPSHPKSYTYLPSLPKTMKKTWKVRAWEMSLLWNSKIKLLLSKSCTWSSIWRSLLSSQVKGVFVSQMWYNSGPLYM